MARRFFARRIGAPGGESAAGRGAAMAGKEIFINENNEL